MQTARHIVFVFLLAFIGTACEATREVKESRPVRVGAAILGDSGFAPLAGKRVGLITNQTAVVDGRHLVDILNEASDVHLAAVFAPEHGFRGTVEAGLKVSTDSLAASVPVYSLYGETRAPSEEMLKDLDVLVFDIQDIGARFYTYISTMGLAMQAAAENDVPFVVLDRPNPLGGNLIDGPLLDDSTRSFVGLYPVPIVHGLTVGELALMIKGEGYLEGLEGLELSVIEVEGWDRTMQWPATRQEWIPTSPNIPNFETALVYPGVGLLEATRINEGRGTYAPFLRFGAPGLDAGAVLEVLQSASLPGLVFDTTRYMPVAIESMSTNPRHKDIEFTGIGIKVAEAGEIKPVELGIHILTAARDHWTAGDFDSSLNARWMRLLSGSGDLQAALKRGLPAAEIIHSWQSDLEHFREVRSSYLIYD